MKCAVQAVCCAPMGGLDVTGCCRLCLKDASSATAVRIDLQQEQIVADLIYELYAVNVS